jgi:acyl-coenzyme A synthetase/AMP-(fatty) acid ligase
MKARHIRKLRKRLQEYQTYMVIPSTGIFYEFKKENAYVVKASGCIHAIERYMKHYWRKHKRRSEYYRGLYHERSYVCSNLCVIDEKGYKRYYI